MLFSDWDRSGRRDLRISNDRHYYSDLSDGQDQLWRIAPGEAPRLYTADDGWKTVRIQGMGIGSYDVTGDGYPDVYLTSQGANELQTLLDGPSKPTYRDISIERGVTATRPSTGGDPLPSTAWHPEFEDVNNDGFVDLFVSKGNVGDQPDYAIKDPSDLFLGRPDGTFSQVAEAAGVLNFERGRGAALVDLNGDGLLDLVLANPRRPVRIWRNMGSGGAAAPVPMGHWIGGQGGRARTEPRCHRRLAGHRGRRHDDPPRADRRGRPRGRPARPGPRRARAGDLGAGPDHVAGRDDRSVDRRRGRPGRRDRPRCDPGEPVAVAPAMMRR